MLNILLIALAWVVGALNIGAALRDYNKKHYFATGWDLMCAVAVTLVMAGLLFSIVL